MLLPQLFHFVYLGSRPPAAVQPRQCMDGLATFSSEGQDSVQVMQLARVVDLTALAIVVCAFHDQFAHAPASFPLPTFVCTSPVVFPGRKGRRRYRVQGKSNERYQITGIRCADSLSEVVVVTLKSISIGLEDEVPNKSTSLSLAACVLP